MKDRERRIKGNKEVDEKKSIKINKSDIYKDSNMKNKESTSKKSTGQKTASSTEVIDKVVSTGKSLFTGTTLLISAGTILTGAFFWTTGADIVPILEKLIYTDEETAVQESKITKMNSLDLKKNSIPENEFNDIFNRINADLNSIITDKELFHSGRETFNNRIREFYSEEYIAKISSDDVLYNSLVDIYSSENRRPFSVTLTSIGKVLIGDEVKTKISIDINAEDDDLGFHVWNLALFLTPENLVSDIKVLSENRTMSSTRTPLVPEDSSITNSSADALNKQVSLFIKGLTNEGLYKKLLGNNQEMASSQLKAFISKINIEQKNYDALIEMFKLSKGNANNFSVTEYISTDFEADPITSIILSINVDDEIHKFNLQFNRLDKALTDVTKI